MRPWWPQTASIALKFKFDSDLRGVTLIILVYICWMSLRAALVTSEAMVASKHPRRSLLTSNMECLTSMTHVPMLTWHLPATVHKRMLEEAEEGQI